MTMQPSAAQPAALKLDASTLPTLTAQRDHFQALKQDERREWYGKQVARYTPEAMEEAVSHRSQELLEKLIARLHAATSEGKSSVTYQAIFRHESVGWKFAQVYADGLISGPLDLSMLPFDHTVRIQATERVVAALVDAGLTCELRRVPSACENCFLEELSLKVAIP